MGSSSGGITNEMLELNWQNRQLKDGEYNDWQRVRACCGLPYVGRKDTQDSRIISTWDTLRRGRIAESGKQHSFHARAPTSRSRL
jgi:hypothetical protein